jgi:hypothetical protein
VSGLAPAPERARSLRWFVFVPFLHLGACAADLVSEQVALTGLFCTVSDQDLHSLAATGLILALLLSLPLGFFAIRFRRLRPAYFILLALVPVSIFGLDRLIGAGTFTCDGP